MMTFSEVKNSVTNFLDIALTPFETCDLNNRRYKGDFYKIASDYMYHMRLNNHIRDHQITIRAIEPFNPGLGYYLIIKFWLYDSDPTYQFKYTFEQTNYRAFNAYERAMKAI